MLPSDVRLFTWIDVEEVLARALEGKRWPEGVHRARAYWDGLVVEHAAGAEESVFSWLADEFKPRIQQLDILLEAVSGEERTLPIRLEVSEQAPDTPRFLPSFARPRLTRGAERARPNRIQAEREDDPTVTAFFSFKGGVGRTTHALALALALRTKLGDGRVLLIDGDLEAPGLSWLAADQLGDPPVSYSDFIALVHGDPDPDAEQAVAVAAERLRSGGIVDGIFVLPAFRTRERWATLEVRPENVATHTTPYRLNDAVVSLGRKLDVRVVVIDLRAGLSELGASFLLDPNVMQVLVTSPGGQSVEGTKQVLRRLGRLREEGQPTVEWQTPRVVVSQVPAPYRDAGQLRTLVEGLSDEFAALVHNPDEFIAGEHVLASDFHMDLVSAPLHWRKFISRVESARLADGLEPLVELVGSLAGSSPHVTKPGPGNLKLQRRALQDFASKMEYAESGDATELLTTGSLERLAADHRVRPPVLISIGAKGAGKTFTYLQMLRAKRWEEFVGNVLQGDEDESIVQASVFPLLKPNNLGESAEILVREAESAARQALELSGGITPLDAQDRVRQALKEDLDEGQWRELWIDLAARRLGAGNTGGDLLEQLKKTGTRLVLAVDGLEDLFQDIASASEQQRALRGLLQSLPELLKQIPNRRLGLVAFVRADLVTHAIRQNAGQLRKLYEPYALNWSRKEAIELVGWVAKRANAVGEELGDEALRRLWGLKLGRDNSREGRSTVWALNALSMFNGEVQARDLIRLVARAANLSIDDTQWKDRLLTPQSIKTALPECGKEKIEEIRQENPPLGRVLNILEEAHSSLKEVPFDSADLGLSNEQLEILKTHGVVAVETDGCYLPEIYRQALEFRVASGKRPRVINLPGG